MMMKEDRERDRKIQQRKDEEQAVERARHDEERKADRELQPILF